MLSRKQLQEKRKLRTRGPLRKVRHDSKRMRLCVYRSNAHVYAQVVDDKSGNVLCAASTLSADLKTKLKTTSSKDAAREVGQALGRLAIEKKITDVYFDRSGYVYHGRIAALADGARAAGLKF